MIGALLALALGVTPAIAQVVPAAPPAAPTLERRPFVPAPRPLTPPTSYAPVTAAPPPTAYAPAPATLPPRATLPPNSLTNASEAQVRARLGQPDIARREAGGALWTYTGDTCALLVFLTVQGREGLRVTGASAGPRQRGQRAPELEACIASHAG